MKFPLWMGGAGKVHGLAGRGLALQGVRENWCRPYGTRSDFPLLPQDLRPFGKLRAGSGLTYSAAPRLDSAAAGVHRIAENLVLTHTPKPCPTQRLFMKPAGSVDIPVAPASCRLSRGRLALARWRRNAATTAAETAALRSTPVRVGCQQSQTSSSSFAFLRFAQDGSLDLCRKLHFAGIQYTSSLIDPLSVKPRRFRMALLCSIISGCPQM